MRYVLPAAVGPDRSRDRGPDGRRPARRRAARCRRHRHRGARSGAVRPTWCSWTTPSISTALAATRAGVCLTTDRFAEQAPAALTVLRTAQPFRDFVVVSRKLFPDALRPRSLFDAEGVAPGAIVHPTAEIEDGVDDRPRRGDRSARGDRFGDRDRRDRRDRPGRSDRPRLLGRSGRLDHACADRRQRHRCTAAAASGRTASATIRAPRVTSRCRSSAASSSRTTSRSAPTPRSTAAACGDTVIGEGTKIDNLVQIGHNCTIGRHCIICRRMRVLRQHRARRLRGAGRPGRHRRPRHHRRGRGRRAPKAA